MGAAFVLSEQALAGNISMTNKTAGGAIPPLQRRISLPHQLSPWLSWGHSKHPSIQGTIRGPRADGKVGVRQGKSLFRNHFSTRNEDACDDSDDMTLYIDDLLS